MKNKATYYHDKFENRKTSSGEVFSQKKYTAAHKTLPLHTIVRVVNQKNGRSVFVKINDRCARHGIIDLSKIAAKQIDLFKTGTTSVNVEVLGKEYEQIWKQQSEIFEMFERTNMSEQDQIAYMDSLVLSTGTAKNMAFSFNYYVRVGIVEGKTKADELLSQIPEKYKQRARVEKIYNESFYYVSIGPFASKEEGEDVVSELKQYFPVAHLIKKKYK
ncbi:MAG: septal ring lytic transglycosylase RlpA family protein [Bacteroidales bacterium]|nr:septal ring lytic transglycosylase RlpA family protein [Bacteroidales bacterium]